MKPIPPHQRAPLPASRTLANDRWLTAFFAIAAAALPLSSAAAPGGPDILFGDGGSTITMVGQPDNGGFPSARGSAMVVQPDGKILMAGQCSRMGGGSQTSFAVVRYHHNGSLDYTFGGQPMGSRVITDIRSDSSDTASDIALQNDGKILVTGTVSYNGFSFNRDIALVRYLANGTLDPAFGTGGKVLTDFADGSDDHSNCMLVQADGKIVVGGTSTSVPAGNFALARYLPDGSLDASFGTGGKATLVVATYSGSGVLSLAALPDGKILAVGESYHEICLVRFLANGTPDPSFGIAGKTVFTPSQAYSAVAVDMAMQSGGRILVVGSLNSGSGYDQCLCRFLADGTPDPTFASNGTAILSFGGDDYGREVLVRPDGRIVLAGTGGFAGEREFTMSVFDANGSLDPAFGDGGVSRALATPFGEASCAALHNEDKILVGGYAQTDSYLGFALARFDGTAQPEIAAEYPAGTPLTDGAATINFGEIVVGGYKEPASLTIRNTGTATLYLQSRLDGANPADFRNTSVVGPLAPGASMTAQVTFYPLGSGARSATLRITTNDSDENPFDINLTGNALPGYDITTLNPLPIATVGVPYTMTFAATGGIPPYQWSPNYTPTPGLTFANGVLSGTPTAAGFELMGVRVYGTTPNADDFRSFQLRVLAQTDPGARDVSFSTDGTATSAIGSGNDRTSGMAIQSDGKIVVAGYSSNGSNYDAALLRYQINGTLDNGFGSGGRLVSPLGTQNDYARATAIQANGGIVVAADSYNGSNSDIIVTRCSSAGVPDTSYGASGKTTVTFGASSGEMARAIAIQPDGKAVIAGFSDNGTVHDAFAVVRLTTAGALDGTFGTGGKVNTSINGNDDSAAALTIQPDGKIIVVGQTTLANGTTDFAVVRYLTNGTLDSGFGSGGKVVVRTSFGNDGASGVVVQGDGRIVVAGTARSGTGGDGYFAMVRLLADGSLDTSFGSYGITASEIYMRNLITGGDYQATAVAIDGAGRLLVAGSTNANGTYDFVVARYLTNGELDAGFGNQGVHILPVGTGNDYGMGMGLRPDGRIVLAGDTSTGSSYDIAVVRLMGPATPAVAVEMPAGYVLADGAEADCGSPALGASPVVSQLTVRNAGGAALSGLAIAKDGPNAADFTVGALGATTLASGASTTFTVSFLPSAVGTRQAAVRIASNDADHNPFDLVLTGTGRVPPVISTTSPLPQGMVGAAYDLTFAATAGVPPYTWSVPSGTPPQGLGLTASGLMSGTPSASGVSSFTVRATGADGLYSDLPCHLTIIAALTSGGADPTFGTAGKVTTAVGTADESIQALARQSDGRILAAGYAQVAGFEDFALARYLESGSLDPSFGTGGVVITPVGSNRDYGRCLALQSDGRIVVAGECWTTGAYDFGIVRYLPNGTLDTTFGTAGKVLVSIASSNDYVRAVFIQADGRIIVMGEASTDFGLIRLNPNGTLDTAFGTAGKVVTDINGNDYALTGALQSDGRILVAGRGSGTGGTDFILARYLATGALDTSFDGDGKASTAVGSGTAGDYCHCLALQSDGKILAAGYSASGNDDCSVVRYQANGSLDTTFGTGGKAIVAISSYGDRCLGVALQSDGAIVLTGYADSGQNDDFALARLLPNGAVDNSLGTTGKMMIPVGSGADRARAVLLCEDGRIILGGESHNGSNLDFALVRYLGSTTPEIAVDRNSAALEDAVSAVDFGTTTIGGAVFVRTFVISNPGTAPLTGIVVSADGSHPADFVISQPASTALAPGASTSFSVVFQPVAVGNRQAGLHITSNDANESPFDIHLTGTCGTPIQLWRATHFGTPDNGGFAADSYDYDFDGSNNLLEYAFAGNPKVAASGIRPVMPPLPGGQRAIAFRCDATRTDLVYTVQASSTLAPGSWTDIARSTGGATMVPLGGLATVSDSGVGLRLVSVTPAPAVFAAGKGFLRVMVSH